MNNAQLINVGTLDVYESIYGPHYNLTPRSLAFSHKTINNHMEWAGIGENCLSKTTIFNIGTGREAYIFHKLRANHIVHADLSTQAIVGLKLAATREGWVDDITSLQGDICEAIPPLQVKVGLAYLNGVLHHLHSPVRALENISGLLAESALFLICIYRTGSFLFFLVSCIRSLVWPNEKSYFLDNQERLMYGKDFDFTDLIDDLFVPVLNLFDLDDLSRTFKSLGFEHVKSSSFVEYDHEPEYSPFCSFLFRKTGNGSALPTTIKTVDQIKDISYHVEHIRETIRLLHAYMPVVKTLSLPLRASFIINAYAIESDFSLDERGRHSTLQALIVSYMEGQKYV